MYTKIFKLNIFERQISYRLLLAERSSVGAKRQDINLLFYLGLNARHRKVSRRYAPTDLRPLLFGGWSKHSKVLLT